jgi:4-deoxy-L-threo-5-hexosulose-uronate ketol-isomerase
MVKQQASLNETIAHSAEEFRVIHGVDPGRLAGMDTRALRQFFLIDDLFEAGRVRLVYSSQDRLIVGSVVPVGSPLRLGMNGVLRSGYFTERRELGIFNLGGGGTIRVEGIEYRLETQDALYVGRGNREVIFASAESHAPALYWLASFPAHASHPVRLIRRQEADAIELGEAERSNRRAIYRYIHPGGVQSCQLVAGLTEVAPGSVWNTMPVHTHDRRSEVYLYFRLPGDGVVFHCVGLPQETRHVVVRNLQAVLSPAWSIHCGAGTSSYAFVWAMGGENQDFADMDPVRMEDLA